MPEETHNPEAREAKIAALRERRKDAAVPAGIYGLASAAFLVQGCGFDIGFGHGNTNVKTIIGLGFATIATLNQLVFLNAGDEIRKIEQQNED